ncbi:MAG: cation-transporting P-type ATPase [Gammaproteobacteria bacterium]
MQRPVPLERLQGLLDTDRGLYAAEVAERSARYGANDILVTPPGGWRELLLATAKDPMIAFLLATSALYAGLGEYDEAVILLLAIAPLIGMDFYLHRRTQLSTQGLTKPPRDSSRGHSRRRHAQNRRARASPRRRSHRQDR